jgi:hypothetical protein
MFRTYLQDGSRHFCNVYSATKSYHTSFLGSERSQRGKIMCLSASFNYRNATLIFMKYYIKIMQKFSHL